MLKVLLQKHRVLNGQPMLLGHTKCFQKDQLLTLAQAAPTVM